MIRHQQQIRCTRHFMIAGFAILLAALLLVLGCAALKEIVNIQQPTLDVKQVRFTDLSFEALDLAFDINIQNPNPLGISLAGFDYDFLLNDASFLKGKQDSQMTIASMGASMVTIPLSLKFNDLYNTYKALQNQDSTAYKIGCGLTFDLPVLGIMRLPVSKTGHLPLLKLPKIADISLKLSKLSLTTADLELKLLVDNPNSFAMALNKLNYNFVINGQSWAKGVSGDRIQVNKKDKSSVSIPVSLNFLQVGKTLYQALANKDQTFNYNLTGDLDFNTSVPLLGQVNLPIDRTGQLKILR